MLQNVTQLTLSYHREHVMGRIFIPTSNVGKLIRVL